MATTKNIIFDLGGVLLDIDYHRTANAFKQLGATDFDQFYSQAAANHLFEQLEMGMLDDATFYSEMKSHCNPGTSDAQIKAAWNAILLDFRPKSIAHLLEMKANYNVYLLSNTNHIHYEEFDGLLLSQTGQPSLDSLFVKAYYSHRIGQRKPYESTYRFVLDNAGIKAEETLFIDDSPVNIPPAAAVGIKTHLLLPGETIELLNYQK
jgi:putative hydrolase of the HAD superfamily